MMLTLATLLNLVLHVYKPGMAGLLVDVQLEILIVVDEASAFLVNGEMQIVFLRQ